MWLISLLLVTGAGQETLALGWQDNMLRISADWIPTGQIEVWYLEAYCRGGAHDQDWGLTTLPHQTRLISAEPGHLRLRCTVAESVTVDHDLRADRDCVTIELVARNTGTEAVEIVWGQPCMRVGRFAGFDESRNAEDYIRRCFIFTDRGQTFLPDTRRTTKARYTPGQVYVPAGIDPADVNPRPISLDRPVNGLIGAVSADQKWLVAMAWSQTHELFQGIIGCVHADFHLGGLEPGEEKRLRGKIYILPNDPERLLQRYQADFPDGK